MIPPCAPKHSLLGNDLAVPNSISKVDIEAVSGRNTASVRRSSPSDD